MQLAPIALFAYKRLDHIRRTLEALRNNPPAAESELFVFSDGSRSDADREKVAEVRAYLKTVTGFKNVTVIERERNLGLAQSIIGGVTEVVNRYGRIIVLEDDMVTSPHFLRYMNEALESYEHEERVISIHGYVFPVSTKLPETFFLGGADCWGWATWKRGWDLFEPDGGKLLAALYERNLKKRFDYDGAYPFTRMLKDQVAGRNDSWAVRWYASALLEEKLTLYPGRSLVKNIGMDASGTHCWETDIFNSQVTGQPVVIGSIVVEENLLALREIENFFRKSKPARFKQVMNTLKKFSSNLIKRWECYK